MPQTFPWHGSWRNFPDLKSFPQVPGATVTSIPRSPEVDELWAKSRVLCYGADSHIRLLYQEPASGDEQFPVCKVAANDCQRRFIVDEYEMLRGLGANAAPVVRVRTEPREGHLWLHDGEALGHRPGQLLVIDPGSKIPVEKRSPWWRAECYSFEADYISLDNFFRTL